jgi:4'-phosphopantetheinyl transferase
LAEEESNVGADCFEYGANGKPYLRTSGGREFNLSHSENWALIGFTYKQQLGVDVEIIRPIPDLTELASRHFTESEQAELAAGNADLAVESFLRGWTRKEACLKALGVGLTLEASEVEASLSPEERVVRVAADLWDADVRVVSVDLGPRLIGAVARLEKVRRHGSALQ